MKTITKKIMTSVVSAAISLTAAATFALPATPVLAATYNSSYSYSYEQAQFNRTKAEGIRFLQNCVSDPSPVAVQLTNNYITAINNHPYDSSKTPEQNNNDIIRYVNNVYKNIINIDNNYKLEAYKANRIAYLYSLVDNEPTDSQQALLDYIAYALSYITYYGNRARDAQMNEYTSNENIKPLEVRMSEVDRLIAIGESALLR